MAVYDRWHKQDGGVPCREHSRGRARLYPSAAHGQGDRWQVRYRDENGKQRKKNFRVREGRDPGRCADAFDAQVRHELDKGDWIDPDSGEVTFREYAEAWRRTRVHDTVTAAKVEQRLRLHAYPAIGGRRMRELAARPSLIAAWIAGMTLRESSARLVVTDVSAVFRAAVDDGIVRRDPTRAASVSRPGRGARKARPWTLRQVAAMSDALPPRYGIVPWLGAGTGMRQGEMFGLSADDVVFLGRRPVVRVRRQVKYVAGRPHFAPVKNRRPHEVPLAASLAPLLARHMELYPPREVTLPWHDPRDPEAHGRPVTVRLVLTRPDGRVLGSARFNEQAWYPAQEAAGITPPREPGQRRVPARDDGCHALRHTAASVWLAKGVDAVRVAAWLGDTVAVVLSTYAHMLPGESGDDGRAAMDEWLGAPDAPSSGRPGAPQVPHGEENPALCLLNAIPGHFHGK